MLSNILALRKDHGTAANRLISQNICLTLKTTRTPNPEPDPKIIKPLRSLNISTFTTSNCLVVAYFVVVYPTFRTISVGSKNLPHRTLFTILVLPRTLHFLTHKWSDHKRTMCHNKNLFQVGKPPVY